MAVFSVSRTVDENYRWDGDGPDPVEEGFDPCDVDVSAKCIIGGQEIEANTYLGGSYFKQDEPCDDVHGYLPQMLEESTEELIHHPKVEVGSPLHMQLLRALEFLRKEMDDRYKAQREIAQEEEKPI